MLPSNCLELELHGLKNYGIWYEIDLKKGINYLQHDAFIPYPIIL